MIEKEAGQFLSFARPVCESLVTLQSRIQSLRSFSGFCEPHRVLRGALKISQPRMPPSVFMIRSSISADRPIKYCGASINSE